MTIQKPALANRFAVALLSVLLFSTSARGQATCSLDIDGDGKYLASTDAVILTRLALGITGDAVVSGALTSGSTRRTYEDVRAYLMQNCNLATLQFAFSSLSAKPTRVAISRGDQATLGLTYDYSNAIPDSARLRVSGAPAYDVSSVRQANGVWAVSLRTPSTLPVGQVTLTIGAELCTDPSCTAIVPNSYAQDRIFLNVTRSDWTAHQGNRLQTGYVPMSFATVNFQRLWDWSVPRTTPTDATALTGMTAEDGKIAVSSTGYFAPQSLFLIDEQSGQQLWKKDFSSVTYGGLPALNAPTIFGGQVFVASSGHGDTFMHAFRVSDGTLMWKTAFGAQWEHYLAPTVYGGKVYQNTGSYGGASAFDAASGETLWSVGLPQFDLHSLAVEADTAYAFVSQTLYALDATTGATKFQLFDPSSPSTYYSMNRAPAIISPGRILAGSEGGPLVVFDTVSRNVLWRSTNTYRGQPAYRDGLIFAYGVNPLRLDVLNADNGSVAWTWTPPSASQFCRNVLVTDTHVFSSSDAGTHAISLATKQSEWSDSRGGYLALTGGRTLLIKSPCTSSANDTLSGFRILN